MMTYLTTSVIIPMHNAENKITATLNSILNQEIPFTELIIIDDCSTDNSIQIVEHFKNKHHQQLKIIIIQQLENLGVSATRNQGIKKAQGQLLIFCDADDQFHTRKNEWIQEFFKFHPSANGLVHRFNTEWKALPENIKLSYFNPLPLWKNILKNKGQGSSIIINNKESSFYFKENLRFSEDFEITNRLAHTKLLYYLNFPLTKLSRPQGSEGGLSQYKWAMRAGEIKSYFELVSLSKWWALALPFLILYSLFKHLIRITILKKKN